MVLFVLISTFWHHCLCEQAMKSTDLEAVKNLADVAEMKMGGTKNRELA